MSVTTFERVIENGQIRLPAGVVLPERKIVSVIVPGSDAPLERAQAGFRLANPTGATRRFRMGWHLLTLGPMSPCCRAGPSSNSG